VPEASFGDASPLPEYGRQEVFGLRNAAVFSKDSSTPGADQKLFGGFQIAGAPVFVAPHFKNRGLIGPVARGEF